VRPIPPALPVSESKLSDASPDTPQAETAALSFEQALAELEKIVGALESGQTPLEESIRIYERGAALKAHCEAKLEAARLRVEKITLSAGAATGAEPAEFS
jgi:exodeoxyribonuclease VII small subunit